METILKSTLEEEGYTNIVEIPGQGICGLYRFMFTTGLVIGMDVCGYKGRYCYGSMAEARDALTHWDGIGDPPGKWIKYKGIGGERSRIKDKYENS